MNNEILAVVAGQNITEEDYNYFVQRLLNLLKIF